MDKKYHICFFTGKRGGFTHLIPIFEKLSKEPKWTSSIIAADMHLSEFFGDTINAVKPWSDKVYHVETLMHADSKLARTKSLGIGIVGFSELLSQIRPDFVFVLGDRGEVLAMTICALEFNIPIIHLFGGDVCQGGVDEPVRHAITKLSNIHLASNQESANRIVKMGEEHWRVHNVGSPVIDLIHQGRYTSPEETYNNFSLDPEKPILLLLQHSVTWQTELAEFQIRQTLEAIDHYEYQTIAIYPCADPGYEAIINVFLEYNDNAYIQLHNNIEFQDFWGLMSVADVFIGNSSAGVMETASFKVPFINIGIRQEGRLRADNVIDVDHNKEQIIDAIQIALSDKDFLDKVQNCVSPYGDGNASDRIIKILNQLELGESLIQKKLVF